MSKFKELTVTEGSPTLIIEKFTQDVTLKLLLTLDCIA